MAWVKVPLENHPVFHAALPKDPRVETMKIVWRRCGQGERPYLSGLLWPLYDGVAAAGLPAKAAKKVAKKF